MHVLFAHIDDLLRGARQTVVLLALSWVGALVLGTVVAMLRQSVVRPARVAGGLYIAVFRNIPIPAQMIAFVFGLPLVGIQYSLFTSAIIVLIIYTAAFVAETLRSGINTVSDGEVEAARALGMSPVMVLRLLVLPQAYARVVQPLGNVMITLMKNTSVVAIVGVADLTYVADRVAVRQAQVITIFAGAMLIYIALGLILGFAVGLVDRKVAIRR